MRADRLVAVLPLLQARGRVTAAEVAQELEVSVRTARRVAVAAVGPAEVTEHLAAIGRELVAHYPEAPSRGRPDLRAPAGAAGDRDVSTALTGSRQ